MKSKDRIYPGDLVEVKNCDEILQTLDGDGTLDALPFMPEMVEFCGRRFRVYRRVVKTCMYGTSSTMCAFPADDVVILEGLRCSGESHDGCEKACTIFWRDAWLRKVTDAGAQPAAPARSSEALRARLKTKVSAERYFCQASELSRAARVLSRQERFTKCFGEVVAGNCNVFQMIGRLTIWMFWRIRRSLRGAYARGTNKTTPVGSLQLQAGELVKVRSIEGIAQTLDERSYNRGLWFSPGMRVICGSAQQVERRIDKLIVDGTGQMRPVRSTVFLKGSLCSCSEVAFGGCSRAEFNYWREIWLERPADTAKR